MVTIDPEKYYLFYDGDCGLCNHWVQWVLAYDRKDAFRFVALQSDLGQQFLSERGLGLSNFQTLYLWKPQAFYLCKSDAILAIARQLGGWFRLLRILGLLPKSWRDWGYNQISTYRLKLASAYCVLPKAEEQHKFL